GAKRALRRDAENLIRFAPGEQGYKTEEIQRRRGGRVVEGARLESVYTGNRIAGSNPAPSATTSENSPSSACHSGLRQITRRFRGFARPAVAPPPTETPGGPFPAFSPAVV